MAVFTTKYMSAIDLSDDEDSILTIRSCEKQEMLQDDKPIKKWVLSFEETDAALLLNDTNGRVIRNLHGRETDDWIGKKIALYVHPGVEYNGVHMRGIRVRSRVPA